MAIFGALNYLLGMETSGWTKGAEKAGRDLDKLQNKSKGFFKDLKSSFGKGSTLGQSLKLAAGGGAIAGLTLAGRELGEFAAKINEIKHGFQEGKMGAGDMVEAIAGGLPVMGQFWQAGREIRNIFTGEKDAIEEINKMLAENQKIEQSILAIKKDAAKADADAMRDLYHDRQKLEEAKAPEGLGRELVRINHDSSNAIDDAQRSYERNSKLDELKDTAAEIEKIRQKNMTDSGQFDSGKMTLEEGQRYGLLQAKLKALQDEELRQRQIFEERVRVLQQTGFAKAAEARKKDADDKQRQLDAEHKKEEEALKQNIEHNLELGKRLTEEAETPLERFLKEMQKIDVAQQVGLIDQSVHDRLEKKYASEFDKIGFDDRKAPTQQHIEGAGWVLDAKAAADPVRSLNDTAKQQLAEQRKQTKLTEDQVKAAQQGTFVLNF